MTKKEALDILLLQVEEEKRADLIDKLSQAKTKEERLQVLEDEGISTTKESWEKAVKEATGETADFEISDEELDMASGGGCCWDCTC